MWTGPPAQARVGVSHQRVTVAELSIGAARRLHLLTSTPMPLGAASATRQYVILC